MLTLAIDSSQDVCSLAIGRDCAVVAEYHFAHKMNLLRRLLPNIDNLLADCSLSKSDLDAVILGTGPGSFTGLRIGATTAKSLAYVLGKPIAGIGTLDAMAHGAANGDSVVCPMIFARVDEVYWSVFDSSGERVRDYAVSTIGQVLDYFSKDESQVLFCGTGARRNWEVISANMGDAASIAPAWTDYTRGAALIDLGVRRIMAGDVDDAMTLTPLYVRKPMVGKVEVSD
ncbi:MAG: tRNA (adenosine(37)-N6)-threonylcarbamoyltransferase complex dimerization subunit type 1 TsaB [Armatimonadetes bacterium]|jgi:tRNA threonylcarbamoyl adenosine modification protein YeaZ|nr:tRNA (adenosine(37)-N6)-threonylcarbamoyltransferase complex dimerization subunit type 1 TsaB [Armatimonadota bacterium]